MESATIMRLLILKNKRGSLDKPPRFCSLSNLNYQNPISISSDVDPVMKKSDCTP